MTIRRLFVPDLPEAGGEVPLGDSASRHVRVLRLRSGDAVVLFDGKGRAATAQLEFLGDKVVVCQAEAPTVTETPSGRVALMLAVPKGSKLDDCVRMATELGVDEIALMYTERTIPRWDESRTQSRLDRLTRVASEASAQCERDDVPIVRAPRSCVAWFDRIPNTATRVLFGARSRGVFTLDGRTEQVWCAVGPEGGFTDSEIDLFRRAEFSVASLGRRVLRVETAVPAALALVRDRLDAR